MKNRTAKYLVALALVLAALTGWTVRPNYFRKLAPNQSAQAMRLTQPLAHRAAKGENVASSAVARSNPSVKLRAGEALRADYAGAAKFRHALAQNTAQPLALASADFDEDGVADLVSGYASAGGGLLTLHRGNVDALFPNSPSAQQRKASGQFTDAPFLSPARVFAAPEAPEFLAAGDFNADGHWDIVTAARGSHALHLLPGDGRGGFGPAQARELPGGVTALASGEINRADGLVDLVVAIAGSRGPQALVFESPDGAMRAAPEAFDLPNEAAALAIGRLDDDQLNDLAVAAGHRLLVIEGRDRRLSLDDARRAEVEPATLNQRDFPAAITAVAIGDFTPQARLALLFDDGAVQLLGREPGGAAETAQSELERWQAREVLRVSRSSNLSPNSLLVSARVSTHPGRDLVVVDSDRLRIVAGGAELARAVEGSGAPVAVLPMQLNGDALGDLVILRSGQSAPSLTLSSPSATFTVTNTNDSGPGSLRDAITQANATAGADAINFSIGSGLQTINLLSPLPAITETVAINGATQPGFAGAPLIVVNGSSAGITTNGLVINAANCAIRSLVINGFGHVGIVINGVGATGNIVQGCYVGTNAAGTAAVPNGTDPNSFDIDGVDILGGAHDNTIGGTAAGAGNVISGNRGDGVFIAFDGANNNLVQGNFVGLNAAGTAAIPNGAAIGAFGVELATATGTGPQGNTIGGTTAGAGNVISGNAGAGVGIFNANTNNNLVQGNLIGTNAAGTGAVPNGQHGVAIANPPGGSVSAKNNLVGGTTPAARNIISGNSFDGVFIAHFGTDNNLVQGNYVGTNPAGAAALPNIGRGVEIAFGAQGNTVGGTAAGARNLLSGNNNDGVGIFNSGTTGNSVQGNFIGTNASGTAAVPNGAAGGFHGVEIAFGAQNNTVGGTAAGAGNLVSGNAGAGVGIFNPGTNGNIVQGNLVGTDTSGAAPLPRAGRTNSINEAATVKSNELVQRLSARPASANPITMQNGLAGASLNGATSPAAIGNGVVGVGIFNPGGGPVGPQNNLIGGATASARNVISGNGQDGVAISQQGSNNNRVQGNYIGVNPAGTTAVPNGFAGVEIAFGAQNNQIGGTTAGEGNLISGNTQYGVLIANPGTQFNRVQGNLIGTQADGVSSLGNGSHGVFFSFSAGIRNTIGGAGSGAGNTIAFNGGAGIFADSGLFNLFRRNSNFSNGGLGIDLAPAGVTANDSCDGDSGPNNLQNFVVLTSATSVAGSTTILGTLNSVANTNYSLEFFSNAACDASGNGEGRTYAGAASVTTAANCTTSFTVTIPTSVPVGQFLTATAIDPVSNTSEFSACVLVTAGCTFAISPTNQTFTSGGGPGSVSVTAPGGCNWTAVSNDSFLTITSGSSGSGSGTVAYTVAANSSASPRTGTMTIAGQTFTVTQSGVTCAGIISPTSASFPANGGTGSVSVPAPSGCSWTAASNDPWITITSGGGGTGSGTVNYSVAANTGSARAGTMTIAGQIFTIMQDSSGLQYYPLPFPVRLLDTRPGQSACFAPGVPLGNDAVLTQPTTGTCNGVTIPPTAKAIVGNATVVNFISTGFHWITLYPSDATQPTASNLNFSDNQIVPNQFTVGLGPDGAFKIYSHAATHFIVDITGFYAPPGTGGLYYHLLPSPVRLLDTRPGEDACDAPGVPLADDGTRAVTAHGGCFSATIPSTAKAIVGNATVVNFISSGFHWITLYPFGTAQPNASNLNFTDNHIVPNAFVVGLSSDGKFNIYSHASTHFIVDVAGYFSEEAVDINGAGLLYNPLSTPVRLLETRPGENGCDAPGAPLGNDATRTETAHGTCFGQTIPLTAKAVVGNATVVNFISTGFHWITLYPFGTAQPNASNLNFTANQIVPNAFVVGLSNDGKFNIYSHAATHFIVDLTGYYAP
jgi:hypothetical protein